ncbi:MAG: Ppx/GppA phosphatase family protein [Hyphomonadaceae bacterium]
MKSFQERGASAGPRGPYFAALDLGTNNCRLLVAEPAAEGFRVVGGYSQIVRLGEGLSQTGRLSERAIARTMDALSECAARLSARRIAKIGCIATQACRAAENGQDFLDRVYAELGLDFTIITPEEEARLAVLGCASLIDPQADAALIVDIGGGSTEISWVDPRAAAADGAPPIVAWASTPVGVVTLAEHHPEPDDHLDGSGDWFEGMVAPLAASIAAALENGARLRPLFDAGRAHVIGTSGTVTSLAGVHLDLPRYQRARIDGLWLQTADCAAAAAKLRAMSRAERAAHPCIGRERADLVLPGCAILEAVLRVWPSKRLRVADRGLREGVLMTLIAEHAAARA